MDNNTIDQSTEITKPSEKKAWEKPQLITRFAEQVTEGGDFGGYPADGFPANSYKAAS